ncbi:hypothetical protein CYMTET_9262 [Cymbomonas tetramitiformis]|uniref:Transmembrane protein n=1 Tax=Cymbomonas tetramitiformis TaxID=36881 RepID=A0AAE0FTQ1_9CHLO|nr:hypothetical protein CYMTET_26250 [Cymbomonas tetramitiformis]KAK3283022.1 hypothetical protein CYMTET_9262 [Cymbomonas tetramitiformis]
MNLPPAQRSTLLGLVSLQLPRDDMEDGEWSSSFLVHAARCLGLPQEKALAFEPLIGIGSVQHEGADPSGAFVAHVEQLSWQQRVGALRNFLVAVSVTSGYDARTRVVFRRLAAAMKIDWLDLIQIERALGQYLYEQLEMANAKVADDKAYRYAKIGGAAVAGGVALALTAGLAAPALGALMASTGVTGLTTLAGFMTTTVVTTVFGATGAGLSGYKMSRRTAGVTEFEFELQPGGKNGMAVTLCVSGWLRDKADFKRPWGVELNEEDIPLRERLQRFLCAQKDAARLTSVSPPQISRLLVCTG